MPDQPTTDASPVAGTPPVTTTPPAASAVAPMSTIDAPVAAPPVRASRAPLMISIIALVVAGCAAALAIWQAMLAKQTQMLSQRAFVHVSGPRAAIIPDPKDRNAGGLALTAILTNSGNTPTKNLKYFMRCLTAREPVEEPWSLLFQDKIEKLPLTMGPHGTANAQCVFTATQLQQINDGKLRGYVVGDITYNDRFDDTTLRRTQFSWELSNVRVDPAGKAVTLIALPLGQHNCADEECPLAIMTH